MTATPPPRRPRAFTLDEPGLVQSPPTTETGTAPADESVPPTAAPGRGPHDRPGGGIRWGTLLLSAAGALAMLALTMWFTRFVTEIVARDDWIGWVAFGLAMIVLLAAVMIVLREIVGFFRLRRLGQLKRDAERALRESDRGLEQAVVGQLTNLLGGRAELRWSLARLAEHSRDVRDPGDLLRLADRDVMSGLDGEARRMVAQTAKRVSVATAISPAAIIAVLYVLVENTRLIRRLAGLYGGRPGLLATARLARMVMGHILATGGVALTDDLLGQFLGQDLLRRLSRRLGEGVFNGALTARIGAAAIDVVRPLPFIEAPPIRFRDFVGELLRRTPAETEPPSRAPG